MEDSSLATSVRAIKNSDAYENQSNWKAIGLKSPEQKVIDLLRQASNNFLDKLLTINDSYKSNEEKLKQIIYLVNDLPWDELDTVDREYMATTLAPAIKAAGYEPWEIF